MENEIFIDATDYVPIRYSVTNPTITTTPNGAGVVFGVLALYALVIIGGYVLGSWLLSRVFKKFGEKPSRAWIPFYNIWKFLELGDQKGFWMFVPGANAIFMVMAAYNLGKKIGKSDAFVLLYIFVQPIWLIMMGSKSQTVVANSSASITPENNFAPQPITQPVVNQPPVAQDFSTPAVNEPALPPQDISTPTTPEEPQAPNDLQ